jgi:hypothetical protein
MGAEQRVGEAADPSAGIEIIEEAAPPVAAATG